MSHNNESLWLIVRLRLENEQRNKLTPSQEKEKLMKQVKNDNDM